MTVRTDTIDEIIDFANRKHLVAGRRGLERKSDEQLAQIMRVAPFIEQHSDSFTDPPVTVDDCMTCAVVMGIRIEEIPNKDYVLKLPEYRTDVFEPLASYTKWLGPWPARKKAILLLAELISGPQDSTHLSRILEVQSIVRAHTYFDELDVLGFRFQRYRPKGGIKRHMVWSIVHKPDWFTDEIRTQILGSGRNRLGIGRPDGRKPGSPPGPSSTVPRRKRRAQAGSLFDLDSALS